MAEPAQDDPADNQENQEILGVQGKIVEVFDHGEARADQGPVDEPRCHPGNEIEPTLAETKPCSPANCVDQQVGDSGDGQGKDAR